SDRTYSVAKGFYHPDINIFSVNDSTKFALKDVIKNKIAIINWWSPSCGPCIMEMPELNHLEEEFNNNSEIIFLALNNNPHHNKVIKFLENNTFNFKQYFVRGETAKELNINGIPRTLVIDKKGKIVYDQLGYDPSIKLKKLREVIKSLL
ncbi:MAG TPA: TlpA family protein disulfide reductase, partial [Caldithrix abyssi]|nr:TlpA family protein disulfide reductase [Caldithrix abyssi]